MALRGRAPYRAAITHGWTLDEKGRTMSKSKGIGIDPNDLVKARGAEIARLLVSSVNYVEDVRIFDELLDRLGEAYRKIRNTCRFMLGNLGNQQDPGHPRFDPATDSVPYDQMLEIDRWALVRTGRLVRKCLKGYEEYQFHQVYGALYHFCTVDLSAFYLDILKDRLYTAPTHSVARRSAQTALWRILDAFTRLIAPILSFTSEEVYAAMHEGLPTPGREESVHLLLFPEVEERQGGDALIEEWDRLRQVRESVLKELEEARQGGLIGNALEAAVQIRAAGETAALLERHRGELPALFIVSQVEFTTDAAVGDGVRVEIRKAEGSKCERCWNYARTVGADAAFPTLCDRCVPVVEGMAR